MLPAASKMAVFVTFTFSSTLTLPAVSSKSRFAAVIPVVPPTVATVRPPTMVFTMLASPVAFTARLLTLVSLRSTFAPEISSRPSADMVSPPLSAMLPAASKVAVLVTVIFSSTVMPPAVSIRSRFAAVIPVVPPTVPIVRPVTMVFVMLASPPMFAANIPAAMFIIVAVPLDVSSTPPAFIAPPV